MNEQTKIVDIGDKYLNQVKTFGALGYKPDRILSLLNLPREEALQLKIRIEIPGDIYYNAYMQGHDIGNYNIDATLHKDAEKGDIESIKLVQERNMLRSEEDLRRKLFGV